MSLPRSIDMSDLGGASVTLVLNTETVVLVGPRLQTPKDTSTIAVIVAAQVVPGTGQNNVQFRVRLGTTATGTQVGQPYSLQNWGAGTNAIVGFMIPLAVSFTDYVQVCLTCAQVGATGNATIGSATLLCISF